MSLHVCAITSYLYNCKELQKNAAGSCPLQPSTLGHSNMSDFTQVPVLLLYAVNSLAIKALITSYPESSVRQIAWLQAVVWVSLSVWKCVQRRAVLQLVARQVRAKRQVVINL